jgi:hypothetical protein
MKTSELTGAQLDWAVAKCEGLDPFIRGGNIYSGAMRWTSPSTDWAQGGPIIEREGISTAYGLITKGSGLWSATNDVWGDNWMISGPTPLIAAMRCFVASKLGDGVDIPKELENV